MDNDVKLLSETYENMKSEATAESSLDQLMDDAYKQFSLGRGSSNYTFEDWLANNPIGIRYLTFIYRKLHGLYDVYKRNLR